MELTAPAKHRKTALAIRSSGQGQNAGAGEGTEEDVEQNGAADKADKDRRTSAGDLRGFGHRAARFVSRRYWDWLMMAYYMGRLVWIRHCFMNVYLQPLPSWLVVVFTHLYYLLFVLLNSSWVSMMCHGPGRVPLSSEPTALPTPVAAALRAGQFAEQPFGYEDAWCSECRQTKAPLVHHCSVCNACSIWMDHHCNYAGVCVGFKNHRTFILWTVYGQIAMSYVLIVTLVWLVFEPSRTWSAWGYGALAVFFAVQDIYNFNQFWRIASTKIATGWPSWVMLKKFRELIKQTKAMERGLVPAAKELRELGDERSSLLDSALHDLRTAICDLQITGAGVEIMGLFKGVDFISSLATVFGEPPCWRWMLPCFPGGSGDPLHPEDYDPIACKRWAALDAAMTRCREVKEQRKAWQSEWESRIANMVSRANGSSGGDETIQCRRDKL